MYNLKQINNFSHNSALLNYDILSIKLAWIVLKINKIIILIGIKFAIIKQYIYIYIFILRLNQFNSILFHLFFKKILQHLKRKKKFTKSSYDKLYFNYNF